MPIVRQSGTNPPRPHARDTEADLIAASFINSDLAIATNLRDRSATLLSLGRDGHAHADRFEARRYTLHARDLHLVSQAYRRERAA